MMNSLNEKIEQLQSLGGREEITAQLAKYVIAHPQNAQAWYALSQFVEQRERKLDCLERALNLQPDMAEAKTALLQMTKALEGARQSTGFSPENTMPEKTHVPSMLAGIEEVSSEPATGLVDPAHASQDMQQPSEKKKQAGESTALMAVLFGEREAKYHKKVSDLLVLLMGLVLLAFVFWKEPLVQIGIFAGTLLIYKISMRFINKRNEARYKNRTYSKGARGERTVGALLEALGDDYRVWHDVPITYGNIDHVVVCKSGQIFMIETKAHRGRVTFAGDDLKINGSAPEKNMIWQCLNNLFEVQAIVEKSARRKVWIIAILVFTDAYVQKHPPIKGVTVTYAKNLQWVIRNHVRTQKPVPEIWENLDKLDVIFSRENRTYKEFAGKDFARLRG
jgi:hypothetical protein